MGMSRRRFLRAGGAVLSLPLMPSLVGAGGLPEPSRKLVVAYLPNGLVRRCFFPGEEDALLPTFVGGFNAERIKEESRLNVTPGVHPLEWTSTMIPLKSHAANLSVITGLDRSFKPGQDVHAQAASCYLTSVSPDQAAEKKWKHPNGRSLDQLVGDQIGTETALRSLEISCNGFEGAKESIYYDNISWYGPGRIAPSIKDPRTLYNRLFMADGYRRHVHDVTDLIRTDAKDMARRLDRHDQETLDHFLTMLREIEVRIGRMEALMAGKNLPESPSGIALPRGAYVRLMGDLMILALQMGVTNVCTLMMGPERWDAPMEYEGVFDRPVQHHNMSHNQKGDGYKELQKIDLFHMEQFAYLLTRMQETKEVDGSSILDNVLMTIGAGMGDGATHQYFDLPMIVAGGCQGAIKQGRMIRCQAGTLNSNLWLSVAQLMGLEVGAFADSTGTISQLWS